MAVVSYDGNNAVAAAGLKQIQTDINRFAFGITHHQMDFDATFLKILCGFDNNYDSIENLILILKIQGLSQNRIDTQLSQLKNLFNFATEAEFATYLAIVGASQSNRLIMLEDIFRIIVGQKTNGITACYVQGFGQYYGTLFINSHVPAPNTADSSVIFFDAAGKHRVLGIAQYTNVNFPEGRLVSVFNENSNQEEAYFISHTQAKVTINDTFIKIPGTCTHKIMFDATSNAYYFAELMASNYVLYNLISVPGITITEELLNLAGAEENLRTSILLCQQLGILTDEATKNYNYWLERYLHALDLRTAKRNQIAYVTSQINALHTKGTSSIYYQDLIPSEIKRFVELKVQLQQQFYSALSNLSFSRNMRDNEFANQWLSITQSDIGQLALINNLLLATRFDVEVCDTKIDQPLFVLIMMATNVLEDYILKNQNSQFSQTEKAQFAEELTGLKNADISLIEKMHLLSGFLSKYATLIIHKNCNNARAQQIHYFTSIVVECMRLFLEKASKNIKAMPPSAACSAASSTNSSFLVRIYQQCASFCSASLCTTIEMLQSQVRPATPVTSNLRSTSSAVAPTSSANTENDVMVSTEKPAIATQTAAANKSDSPQPATL